MQNKYLSRDNWSRFLFQVRCHLTHKERALRNHVLPHQGQEWLSSPSKKLSQWQVEVRQIPAPLSDTQ